jgi:hypothetical protein
MLLLGQVAPRRVELDAVQRQQPHLYLGGDPASGFAQATMVLAPNASVHLIAHFYHPFALIQRA